MPKERRRWRGRFLKMRFEKAKVEYFDALFALYTASFPDKAPRLPFEYGIINSEDTYCAVEEDRLLGMVSANPIFFNGQRGHQILKLCTDPAARGKGVAAGLLSFMHKQRREAGRSFFAGDARKRGFIFLL